MKPIEQAIFTVLETGREAGYQVAVRSVGVCEADARELVVWEPSRESMLEMGPDAESFTFLPLPSGAYGISRTLSAGWEASDQRTYSHCLLVPPEVLARFANNPFAILRMMSEHDLWQKPGEPCASLAPFSPPGGAAPVDQVLLQQLATDPGPEQVAVFVQAARNAVCLAVAGTRLPVSLMAGLFSCLPPECRLEFSFSTGLKFSPRRPFRIMTLSDDPAEQLWVANYPNVTVLDLNKGATLRSIPIDGWSRLVERTLAGNHIPFLAAQITKRRFDLSLDDLPALGLQLLESLDSAACRGNEAIQGDEPIKEAAEQGPTPAGGRAHAAHRKFEKTRAAATMSLTAPSTELGVHPPEILEKLEHLDDLVYEAISGQTNALEELRSVWPKLLGELGDQLLAESREQYLRYALSIWEECADAGGIRNPTRAIQALEVLCLLFDDAT
jgi:hypothetical protein